MSNSRAPHSYDRQSTRTESAYAESSQSWESRRFGEPAILRKEDDTERAGAMQIYRKQQIEEGAAALAHRSQSAGVAIDSPNSTRERDADSFADKVAGPQSKSSSSGASALRTGQGDLLAKSESGGLTAKPGVASEINAARGSGSPLPENSRAEMEQASGSDLSDVRVHTGATADKLATGINAKAFTSGKDIFFKGGNFDPNSSSGKHLLAHEVQHTQQGGGGLMRSPEDIARVMAKLGEILEKKNPKNEDAVEAYRYLKYQETDAVRQEFYAYAEDHEDASALIDKMEENLPAEFINSQEYGFQAGLESDRLDSNPVIFKLFEDPETWNDPDLLDLVLSMIVQAGLGKSVEKDVLAKRTPENKSVLEQNGFTDAGYNPGEGNKYRDGDSKLAGIGNFLFKSGNKARKQGLIGGYLEKNEETTLIGFPLPSLESITNGHTAGVDFTGPKEGNYKKPKKPKKKEFDKSNFDVNKIPGSVGTISFHHSNPQGEFLVNANQLPFNSMNFLFSNMVVRIDEGTLNTLIGKFYWAGTENDQSGKGGELDIGLVELNNLRIVSDKTTFAIGKLKIEGVHLKVNQPLGKAEDLKYFLNSATEFLFQLFDGLFVLLDAAFIAVDRYFPGLGTESKESIMETMRKFSSDFNFEMSFQNMEIDNLLYSSMGLVEKITLGKTEVNVGYDKLGAIFEARIKKMKDLAALQGRELSAAENESIAHYEEQIAGEQALYDKYTSLKTQIDTLSPEDKETRTKLQADLKAVQELMGVRLTLSSENGVGVTGVDMASYEVGAVPTEDGQVREVTKSSPITMEHVGLGGKDSLALDLLMQPKGLLETSLSVDLSNVQLNEFIFESIDMGLTVSQNVTDSGPAGPMANLHDAVVSLRVEHDARTGKMQFLYLDVVEIGELVTYGLHVHKDGDKVEDQIDIDIPAEQMVSICGICITGVMLHFPLEEGQKMTMTGQINKDGEYESPASLGAEAMLVALAESTNSAEALVEPTLKFLIKGYSGVVGADIGSVNYTTTDGNAYEITAENPEVFAHSIENLKFDSENITDDQYYRTTSSTVISLLQEDFPFFKAGGLKVVHDPESDTPLVVTITDPHFKDLRINMRDTLGSDAIDYFEQEHLESVIFFSDGKKSGDDFDENYDRWIGSRARDIGGWIMHNTDDYDLLLNGQATGTLQLTKDTKKKQWRLEVPADTGEFKLDLSGCTLDYKRLIGDGYGTKRKELGKKMRKEVQYDSLDNFAATVSIDFFGNSIPLNVKKGGYVSIAPALNALHKQFVKQVDTGEFRKTMSTIEKGFARAMQKHGGFVADQVGDNYSEFLAAMKIPMNTLRTTTYSTKVRRGRYVLVIKSGGEELSSLELAVSKGNVRGSSVKLSALLEYQLNEYPSRKIEEKKGFIDQIMDSYIIQPTLKAVVNEFTGSTLSEWHNEMESFAWDYDSLRAQIDKWYKDDFGFWSGVTGSWQRALARVLIPWLRVNMAKVLAESNAGITINGNLKIGDEQATGQASVTLNDELEPVMDINNVIVPPFSIEAGDKTFGASGIDMKSASAKLVNADMRNIHVEITDGSITNPFFIIPMAEKKTTTGDPGTGDGK